MKQRSKKRFVLFSLVTMLLSFLSWVMPVSAYDTATITLASSNVRSCPGECNRTRFLHQGDVVTIYELVPTKDNSTVCKTGWWYRISDNEYTCTYNTQEHYMRPWTSPEKSIVGGAIYIGEKYIAKGQFTSYLKRFNVNPKGSYSVYTHQYMYNLMAPYSEALISYNAYGTLLNEPLVFSIPVYNNMPVKTTLTGFDTRGDGVATLADEAFETSIKDFPDDYKMLLRELHVTYPNWKFEVMNTGLNFNAAVAAEKKVSSFSSSSYGTKYCDSSGCVQTGDKGWYYANSESVAYFLDSRNFLNAKRILMFEKLTYSDVYPESAIQKVLTNSFMDEYSLMDNKLYSSIFKEAGQKANINPIYLASLAIQEVGRSVGTATSGKPFTYNGITYSGLYNFYNIGAATSAAVPVYAGLVWANGIGENGSELENYLKAVGFGVTGNYLFGLNELSDVADIKSKVGGYTVVVTNGSSSLSDTNTIGTGNTVTISDGVNSSTYTLVVYGDINGDGEINSADLLKVRQSLLGSSTLNGAYRIAADVNKDGDINSADLLRVRQHLLKTNTISQ